MGSCCYEHFDTPVFDEHWPIARKRHRCCECGAVIEPGTQYQNISMLQEGVWFRYKTCEACADLRDALDEVSCPYYQGLAECYQDYITESLHTVMSVKPGTHAARLLPSYFQEEAE